MAIDTFKPEVWAAVLLASLKKSLTFAMLANRNYEGEINEYGDSVNINSISRPTISNYVPNVTVITPETLTTAQRKLVIDQSKYFAFEVDDVDARQARGDVMPEAMVESAYGLSDVADALLAGVYTGVDAANALGTIAVVVGTPTNAYDLVLVPLKVTLDVANVPQQDRWVVVPPWFHGRLLRDDRFIRADATGDSVAAAINGYVGKAAGMNVFVSNNAPFVGGDDHAVIAGYPGAISYAEQIRKVEAYRPENAFSDAIKGLHLYGFKLIRTNGLATAVASQT
jgi:hypothetical protein